MNIKFGHSVNDDTFFYSKKIVGSGYENMTFAFNESWYNLNHLYDTECDVAIINALWGNPANIEFLIDKGKSPNWKKLFLFAESGVSALNNIEYLSDLLKVPFDGYITYSSRLFQVLNILNTIGKKVIYTTIPYPFEFYPNFKFSSKKENKICLDLGRFHDSHGNLLYSLNIIKKLSKDGFYGVAFIEPALISKIKFFIDKFYLQDSLFIFPSTSWKEYIDNVKDCKIFLSMDSRDTWGRFALDAALVGSACIGTYSEVQNIIYPELVFKKDEIDKIIEVIKIYSCFKHFIINKDIENLFSYSYVKENLERSLNG